MYRYTWIELDTLEIWETTVDESYRNWQKKGWDQLSQGDQPYGIYTGLRKSQRTSRQGYGILTADSRPELLLPIESQDLACDVVLKLKEERQHG
jgi:hypothetical protein